MPENNNKVKIPHIPGEAELWIRAKELAEEWRELHEKYEKLVEPHKDFSYKVAIPATETRARYTVIQTPFATREGLLWGIRCEMSDLYDEGF